MQQKKSVTFLEDGQILTQGFVSPWEMIGFMQTSIFQEWKHPVFQRILTDFQKTMEKQIEQVKMQQEVLKKTQQQETASSPIIHLGEEKRKPQYASSAPSEEPIIKPPFETNSQGEFTRIKTE